MHLKNINSYFTNNYCTNGMYNYFVSYRFHTKLKIHALTILIPKHFAIFRVNIKTICYSEFNTRS